MKESIYTIVIIAAAVLLAAPTGSYAQQVRGDTMFVYPNPAGNLSNVVWGDTTATGARANKNRVYVLYGGTSDTSIYYWDRSLYPLAYNLTIIGRPDPKTGMLPVLAPIYRIDGSISSYFIHQNFKGGRTTLKNLFFLNRTPDNLTKTTNIFAYGADSIVFVMDHCVISDVGSGTTSCLTLYNGNGNKAFVTNCEFRNIGTSTLRPTGMVEFRTKTMDTAVFVNNTWFSLTQPVMSDPNYVGYLVFDHNTFFCNVSSSLMMPQAHNASITNNIFYSTFAAGADSAAMTSGLYISKNRIPALILLDSLTTLTQAPYNLTETGRHVTVANNVYSWHTDLYKAWKAIKDTATKDPGLLMTPVWMDSRTASMFSDKTHWPNLQAAHNDSTDPGFASSVLSANVDSMINWINSYWRYRLAGSYFYNQDTLNPVTMLGKVPSGWASKQNYPVPENLRYSNSALYHAGTDGKALGDLNWFPEQLVTAVGGATEAGSVPREFALYQNYPNPFNPSTVIRYDVAKTSQVAIKVYDVLGREVAVLVDAMVTPGTYTVEFNGSRLASGAYFFRMSADAYLRIQKMMLVK